MAGGEWSEGADELESSTPRASTSASSEPMAQARKVEGATVVEGDMLFPEDKFSTIAAATSSTVKRWPKGIVPYDIDPAMPRHERVMAAAAHWLDRTGIKFVPRTNERDYVTSTRVTAASRTSA